MKFRFNKKGKVAIGITAGLIVIIIASTLTIKLTTGTYNQPNVDVSESELQQYKEMIGTSMDIKKSILILFDTYDECKNFIEEHGSKVNPHEQGEGVVPYMPEGYYNIVGKSRLEEFFDMSVDGDYTKEPIEYSGMYCYLKRIGIDSVMDNEEELKKLILQDKEQRNK